MQSHSPILASYRGSLIGRSILHAPSSMEGFGSALHLLAPLLLSSLTYATNACSPSLMATFRLMYVEFGTCCIPKCCRLAIDLTSVRTCFGLWDRTSVLAFSK